MIKTTTTTTSFITLGLEKKALWANSFQIQILTLFYWGGSVQTPLVDLEVVSGAASWDGELSVHMYCVYSD